MACHQCQRLACTPTEASCTALEASKLRHQTRFLQAGTEFQMASEGLLAHFWAHVDPDAYRGVAIMKYSDLTGAAQNVEWIANKNQVLQDAVAHHPAIPCAELTRLGYQLIPRMRIPPATGMHMHTNWCRVSGSKVSGK